MPIVITKPTSQVGITTNIAVFSMSPSFLPPENSKLVVIANASGTLTGSISGAGSLTWMTINSMNPQGTGNSARCLCADVSASPSSVAINIDYAADAATGCTAVALQVTGQAIVGARQVIQVTSIGDNPVVTFPLPVGPRNAVIMGLVVAGQTPARPYTPPSGWTTIAASYAAPSTGLSVAYIPNGANGTTFTFSTGVQLGLAYFGLELWSNEIEFDPVGMMGIFGQ